jgi:hypothetical protein
MSGAAVIYKIIAASNEIYHGFLFTSSEFCGSLKLSVVRFPLGHIISLYFLPPLEPYRKYPPFYPLYSQALPFYPSHLQVFWYRMKNLKKVVTIRIFVLHQ